MAELETIDVDDVGERSSRPAHARWRPRPPRWRSLPWRWALAVGVLAAALLAVDASRSADETDARPSEIGQFSGPVLSGEQRVQIMHHTWLAQQAVAECMAARGFSYAPDPREDRQHRDAVAAELGVEAAAPADPLASPTLLNLHTRAGMTEATGAEWDRVLTSKAEQDGCAPPHHLLYIEDEGDVAWAVRAARADEGFQRYLASELWLADHPVAWARAAALVGTADALAKQAAVVVDGDDAAGVWEGAAADLSAAVGTALTWVPDAPVRGPGRVDLAGLTADGGVLVVRARAEGAAPLEASQVALAGPVVCGDVTVQVAAWPATSDAEAVAQQAATAIANGPCAGPGLVLREAASTVE
ncbi:hypothetical protein [Demequina sp. NBRC 110056]|uniref:hypothetical protein n=1 Tax=Demequina sp. NBRC 110056 TaxID=1570345 RepID=UPI0009FF3D1B|nr:hypothetical protein [Demequina sp. NBRC 110056]